MIRVIFLMCAKTWEKLIMRNVILWSLLQCATFPHHQGVIIAQAIVCILIHYPDWQACNIYIWSETEFWVFICISVHCLGIADIEHSGHPSHPSKWKDAPRRAGNHFLGRSPPPYPRSGRVSPLPSSGRRNRDGMRSRGRYALEC